MGDAQSLRTCGLAANHGHGAGGAPEALVADIVLELLMPDGLVYGLGQLVITAARAKHGPQIGFHLLRRGRYAAGHRP